MSLKQKSLNITGMKAGLVANVLKVIKHFW